MSFLVQNAEEAYEQEIKQRRLWMRFLAHETRSPLMVNQDYVLFAKEDLAIALKLLKDGEHTQAESILQDMTLKLTSASESCTIATRIFDDSMTMESITDVKLNMVLDLYIEPLSIVKILL